MRGDYRESECHEGLLDQKVGVVLAPPAVVVALTSRDVGLESGGLARASAALAVEMAWRTFFQWLFQGLKRARA